MFPQWGDSLSSYGTHLLIGGVGGLALTRVLPAGSLFGISPLWAEIALIGGSAVLASWPDIDEPGSWISRRVRLAVVLVCTAIGGLVGYALAPRVGMQPLTVALIGMLLGVGLIGPILGFLLLRLIRRATGGHRRLTHSLLLGGALAALALILWRARMPSAALVPAVLAWGQLLHLLGDLVTIKGVPVLWPISARDIRLLPAPLARRGEAIVGTLALFAGYLLIRGDF